MHPDIISELVSQRTAERHEAARNAGVARALRKAIRARRDGREAPGTFVVPPVPDYVDGTFRGAREQVPAQRAGAGR